MQYNSILGPSAVAAVGMAANEKAPTLEGALSAARSNPDAVAGLHQYIQSWPGFGSISGCTAMQVARTYASFLRWVRGSLDTLQPALLEVAFALLLLCYAELILRDDIVEDQDEADDWGHGKAMGVKIASDPAYAATPCIIARSMIERHRREVPDWQPGSSGYHADVLSALATLTQPHRQLFGSDDTERQLNATSTYDSESRREIRLSTLLQRGSGKKVRAKGASGADWVAVDLDVLGRLLAYQDPQLIDRKDASIASRYRVALPPAALSLLLDYFARTSTAASKGLADAVTDAAAQLRLDPTRLGFMPNGALVVPNFLFGLMNEGVNLVSAQRGVDGEAGHDARRGLMGLPLPVADVAAALTRSAEPTQGGLSTVVRWGVPHAPAHVYMGSIKREAVPFPDYASSALGHALLSAASAATIPAGAQGEEEVVSAGMPLLQMLQLVDSGKGIRCSAVASRSAHDVSTTNSVLPPGVSVTRVVASGRGDGSVHAWAQLTFRLAGPSASQAGASAASPSYVSTTVCFESAADSTHDIKTAVTAIALSPCCGYCLSGHADGVVRMWQLSRFAAAAARSLEPELRAAGFNIAPSVSEGNAGSPFTAVQHASSLVEHMIPLAVYGRQAGHGGLPVFALSFNPLSTGVWASGGRDGAAYVWSTALVHPQRVCAGHAGAITALAWHPNGLYLFTGSADGSGRLWDAGSGEPLAVYGGGRTFARVSALAPSPAGRYLATGTDTGVVTLWEVPSGMPLAQLAGHAAGSPVDALAWSAAGTSLVCAGVADAGAGHSHVCTWSVPKALGGAQRDAIGAASAGKKRERVAGKAPVDAIGLTGLAGILRCPGQQLHALCLDAAGNGEAILCIITPL